MECDELLADVISRTHARPAYIRGDRALGAADLIAEFGLSEPSTEEVDRDLFEVCAVHEPDYHFSDYTGQAFSITKAMIL